MSVIDNLKARGLPVERSLEAFALARSAVFQTESFMGPAIDLLLHRKRPKLIFDDPEMFKAARGAMIELLKQDVANITTGVYPLSVLMPGNPLKHLARLPTMFKEGIEIALRRRDKKAHPVFRRREGIARGLARVLPAQLPFSRRWLSLGEVGRSLRASG